MKFSTFSAILAFTASILNGALGNNISFTVWLTIAVMWIVIPRVNHDE